MQISQMIVGVVITVYGFIYARDPECAVVPKVLYVQGIIYGSYLYLFVEFFVQRFILGGESLVEAAAKKQKKQQQEEKSQ